MQLLSWPLIQLVRNTTSGLPPTVLCSGEWTQGKTATNRTQFLGKSPALSGLITFPSEAAPLWKALPYLRQPLLLSIGNFQ